MCSMLKSKKIYPAYVSKRNSNCDKQDILSMILNGKTMAFYSSTKAISIILTDKTSKHYITKNFYCLDCLEE